MSADSDAATAVLGMDDVPSSLKAAAADALTRPPTEADVRLEVAAETTRDPELAQTRLRNMIQRLRDRRDELRLESKLTARMIDRIAAVHGEAFVLETLGMTEAQLLALFADPTA